MVTRSMFFASAICFAICIQLAYAQSHYPGQHSGKFAIADKFVPAIYAFDLQDVRLTDSRFKQNMLRDQAWLLSIDVNRLLHSFRTNAGIYSGHEGGYFAIKKLAGWESLDCELRGHSTGHILSALALMYASTGDTIYKTKGDSLVTGLAEVQRVLDRNGYLSAFPEELINRNLTAQRVWAPWYTLHKILAGLIDQYLYSNNEQALQVASNMASWAYQKLQPVTAEQRTRMLRNEFGGINESFYNLYAITGKKDFQWLAAFFYHNEMLDPLKTGKDILEGKHANTYIPKLIGLTRDYELEGRGDGDSIATFFWQTVVAHHSFCTGSNSDKEKFFQPDHVAAHLTGYTGESCNVYNMLKLTRHLFCHTGQVAYAEYYEKALYNHILGQQDPATGMIAYFLPMLPGAHKVYSTRDSSFWCCVGTGFENQAKFGESIYYHNQDGLFVNLFIPSILNWKEKGLTLQQQTRFPEDEAISLTIETAQPVTTSFYIRYPSWAVAGATVMINGKKIPLKNQPGSYIKLNRTWKNGDRIDITFPMTLRTIATNDSTKVAFAYGPIVLAGVMGTEGFVTPAPHSNPQLYNDYYTYNYNIPQTITSSVKVTGNKISDYIKPVTGAPLIFQTGTENIVLKPLYDIHRERYVVYWKLVDPGQ